jgi:hypothetical protein
MMATEHCRCDVLAVCSTTRSPRESAAVVSKGWTRQRCGRYDYQKVLVHTTNPDHLVPSTPSLTDIPPFR